jgi:hypothetical protein
MPSCSTKEEHIRKAAKQEGAAKERMKKKTDDGCCFGAGLDAEGHYKKAPKGHDINTKASLKALAYLGRHAWWYCTTTTTDAPPAASVSASAPSAEL